MSVEFQDQVISIPIGKISFYYINKMRLITEETSQFKLNKNLIKVIVLAVSFIAIRLIIILLVRKGFAVKEASRPTSSNYFMYLMVKGLS